jgi:anti-sigma B factor antagonist
MKIQDHKKGAIVVVEVEGRLDSVTSNELEKEILSLLQSGESNLLIDFAGLDYISSAGLRVLLMAAKKARTAGGQVVLANLVNNVKEVFDIAGFNNIFPIFQSQDEALAAFKG